MNRAVVGLSVLLLSGTGALVLAIPPPPPDDVRVVRVLDGNTMDVTPYGDPFKVRLACIHAPQLLEGSAGRATMAALVNLLKPGVAGRRTACSVVVVARRALAKAGSWRTKSFS